MLGEEPPPKPEKVKAEEIDISGVHAGEDAEICRQFAMLRTKSRLIRERAAVSEPGPTI